MSDGEIKYTLEEVNHMVAREVAKQRMGDMERALQNIQVDQTKIWAKFDASFDALKVLIEGQDEKFRKEMERDFVTKLDHAELKASVEKMWIRVSAPVAAIVFIGGFVQHWIK